MFPALDRDATSLHKRAARWFLPAGLLAREPLGDPHSRLDGPRSPRLRPGQGLPDLVRDLPRAGKNGRPRLPETGKKQRVTMYLDAEVIARLKADGRD
jgi:hypothetical protein